VGKQRAGSAIKSEMFFLNLKIEIQNICVVNLLSDLDSREIW
jgi:hypothetical protein